MIGCQRVKLGSRWLATVRHFAGPLGWRSRERVLHPRTAKKTALRRHASNRVCMTKAIPFFREIHRAKVKHHKSRMSGALAADCQDSTISLLPRLQFPAAWSPPANARLWANLRPFATRIVSRNRPGQCASDAAIGDWRLANEGRRESQTRWTSSLTAAVETTTHAGSLLVIRVETGSRTQKRDFAGVLTASTSLQPVGRL